MEKTKEYMHNQFEVVKHTNSKTVLYDIRQVGYQTIKIPFISQGIVSVRILASTSKL